MIPRIALFLHVCIDLIGVVEKPMGGRVGQDIHG